MDDAVPPERPARRRFARQVAAGGAAAGLGGTLLGGCAPKPAIEGEWIGASHARGHRLRDDGGGTSMGAVREGTDGAVRDGTDHAAPGAAPAPRSVRVAIVGGGIAGLAAARALSAAGVDDVRIFELEDEVGGNSRGTVVGGLACPMGAHYLPVPGDDDADLRVLLREMGLLRRERPGAPETWDERTLCHAPQERLWVDGHWQSGLLRAAAPGSAAEAAYRRFARLVAAERARFALPADPALAAGPLAELEGTTFARWLDAHELADPGLRAYLDYCCRDDYGAGADTVSAWAGVHYFASRHGFFADEAGPEDHSEVLTWPEGNAALARALAAPQAARIETGAMVRRIDADGTLWVERVGGGMSDGVGDGVGGPSRVERWRAQRIVVALPLFVAARVLAEPWPALQAVVRRMQWASWLVTNLHLSRRPKARAGDAPPAWDNLVEGGSTLGYVDAMHQSFESRPGATVFTVYQSFGGEAAARRALLETPWRERVDAVLREFAPAHPDLRECVTRAALVRWGHGMAIPTPGLRADPAFAALRAPRGRLMLAHSDLAGYSVFEEAFALGMRAGRWAAQA